MKVSQLIAAAALIMAPATGSGAIVAVIDGNGADQFVAGPSTSGPQDATGTSVGNPGGVTLKVGRVSGSNADAGRNAIYVFQLPTLGAVANPFTSASLSFGVQNIDNNTSVDVDLYGLVRRDVTPGISTADYYFGNGADSTDATRLQQSILVAPDPLDPLVGTPENSIVATSASGGDNLAAFLNVQYAGGLGAGQYVYLRLNLDGGINNQVRGFNVHTADDSDASKRPTIVYAAVPEPAGLVLLTLGGLAALGGRRPKMK